MVDHLVLIKTLGHRHIAALDQAVVEKIQRAKQNGSQGDYLDRCREFGLLLRVHGLAQTLCHWTAQEKNCRKEFAADLCEVLKLWLVPMTPDGKPAPAIPEGIRKESLPIYLLHSQIALEVADMFKRYGNALLDELPEWTKNPNAIAKEENHA